MTRYLDEYNISPRQLANKVQSDTHKLKFNNILSCIAVVLLPAGNTKMVGVHLTTSTTGNPAELGRVIQELQAELGGSSCEAYLVSTWSHHAGTTLAKELEKIARKIHNADVSGVAGAADIDVKFELAAGQMRTYVRRHANLVRGPGGLVLKDPKVVAPAIPGKPVYKTDRDDPAKQWMAIDFRKLA